MKSSEVRAIRNSTGLSQKDFAKLLGLDQSTISLWELGLRSPGGAAKQLLIQIKGNPKLKSKVRIRRVK